MSPNRGDSADRRAQVSRRELLQGKWGRLIGKRPGTSSASPADDSSTKKSPWIMRYPRSSEDLLGASSSHDTAEPPQQETPQQETPSINGISISPVPVTNTRATAGRSRPRSIPVFRPPGAIHEPRFLEGCTGCGDCIEACPHDAIVRAPARLGGVAGTPILNADTQPCLMCADFPCIESCEPGVLTNSVPKVMGTARVTEHLCLAHHGTTCTVCSERCPVEGAIDVTDGKPTIREDACTGCGVCRYVCPAPENAILLMPTFDRPGQRNG